MTIKDRIKAFCKEEGITVTAFENSINVSNGYVNAISKNVGPDKLEAIVEKYSKINLEWLLTGRGPMLKGNIVNIGDTTGSTQNTGNNNTTTTNNYNNYKGCGGADKKAAQDIIDIASRVSVLEEEIPITTANAIGCPYYDVDFVAGFDEVINSQVTIPICNILVPGFEKATLWCNVTGHSMKPRINHDDKIALRECTVAYIFFGMI